MKKGAEQFDLIKVPERLSPRLAWMKKHSIKTKFFKENSGKDEFGNIMWPWYAFDPASTEDLTGDDLCGGMTENEAIAEFAIRHELNLWNEEPYGQ
jgi:hypothetical protein